MTHVIAPGYTNSGEDNWQSVWQRGWLADDSVRMQVSDWDHPELEEWVAALAACCHDGDVVLAHSLGCLTTVEALRRGLVRPRAVLLVAPPDPLGESFPEVAAGYLEAWPGMQEPLGVPATVVAGDDDHYASIAAVRRMADAWQAPLEVVPGGGHLNGDSQLGQWPQGRAWLAELEQRARR